MKPEGCECIEDRIYNHNGVRILGLGGSIRYSQGQHQYTQKQMEHRRRMMWRQLRKNGGFDILVTHSPAFGLGDDLNSVAHTGFNAFRTLMDQYHPKYLVHGHVHLNYGFKTPRWHKYGETKILNAFGQYIFEF